MLRYRPRTSVAVTRRPGQAPDGEESDDGHAGPVGPEYGRGRRRLLVSRLDARLRRPPVAGEQLGGEKRKIGHGKVFSRVALKPLFQNYHSHGSGGRGEAVGDQWRQEPVGAVQELLAGFCTPAPCRQVAVTG
jgi:hypothetical protein